MIVVWVLIGVGAFLTGAGGSLLIEWHFQRKARRAGVSLNHGYALMAPRRGPGLR